MRIGAAIVLACSPGLLAAQDVTTRRLLCDPEASKNGCPGERCICSQDGLDVVFDDSGTSILEVEEISAGHEIGIDVVMEAKSDLMQGWSYGVAHDQGLLILESATTRGTDAEKLLAGGFEMTTLRNIRTCKEPPDSPCAQDEPGGGYISSCALNIDSFVLPRSGSGFPAQCTP